MKTRALLCCEVRIPPGKRRDTTADIMLWLGLGATGIAILCCIVPATPQWRVNDATAEATRALTRMYAGEIYEAWKRNHPDRQCPRDLVELNTYSNQRSTEDVTDPWGRALSMSCDDGRLYVWSLGLDGWSNSFDDIRSWE